MSLSFSAVQFVILHRLSHSVVDRFQIGGIFDHFFDLVQFLDIDDRSIPLLR
jgi:hypothetical protein